MMHCMHYKFVQCAVSRAPSFLCGRASLKRTEGVPSVTPRRWTRCGRTGAGLVENVVEAIFGNDLGKRTNCMRIATAS
jgi:hypothetical protein